MEFDLKAELRDTAKIAEKGCCHLDRKNALFLSRLCRAALERIEELEKLTDERKPKETI